MWDDLLEEMIQHFKKLIEENNVQSCNSESDKTVSVAHNTRQ